MDSTLPIGDEGGEKDASHPIGHQNNTTPVELFIPFVGLSKIENEKGVTEGLETVTVFKRKAHADASSPGGQVSYLPAESSPLEDNNVFIGTDMKNDSSSALVGSMVSSLSRRDGVPLREDALLRHADVKDVEKGIQEPQSMRHSRWLKESIERKADGKEGMSEHACAVDVPLQEKVKEEERDGKTWTRNMGQQDSGSHGDEEGKGVLFPIEDGASSAAVASWKKIEPHYPDLTSALTLGILPIPTSSREPSTSEGSDRAPPPVALLGSVAHPLEKSSFPSTPLSQSPPQPPYVVPTCLSPAPSVPSSTPSLGQHFSVERSASRRSVADHIIPGPLLPFLGRRIVASEANAETTPVVHIRVRPLLPSLGELTSQRKVWVLDEENILVQVGRLTDRPQRTRNGTAGGSRAGNSGDVGGGMGNDVKGVPFTDTRRMNKVHFSLSTAVSNPIKTNKRLSSCREAATALGGTRSVGPPSARSIGSCSAAVEGTGGGTKMSWSSVPVTGAPTPFPKITTHVGDSIFSRALDPLMASPPVPTAGEGSKRSTRRLSIRTLEKRFSTPKGVTLGESVSSSSLFPGSPAQVEDTSSAMTIASSHLLEEVKDSPSSVSTDLIVSSSMLETTENGSGGLPHAGMPTCTKDEEEVDGPTGMSSVTSISPKKVSPRGSSLGLSHTSLCCSVPRSFRSHQTTRTDSKERSSNKGKCEGDAGEALKNEPERSTSANNKTNYTMNSTVSQSLFLETVQRSPYSPKNTRRVSNRSGLDSGVGASHRCPHLKSGGKQTEKEDVGWLSEKGAPMPSVISPAASPRTAQRSSFFASPARSTKRPSVGDVKSIPPSSVLQSSTRRSPTSGKARQKGVDQSVGKNSLHKSCIKTKTGRKMNNESKSTSLVDAISRGLANEDSTHVLSSLCVGSDPFHLSEAEELASHANIGLHNSFDVNLGTSHLSLPSSSVPSSVARMRRGVCSASFTEDSVGIMSGPGGRENGWTTGEQHFTFDYIHDEGTAQEELFNESVLSMIDMGLSGKNIAVLCYGPTGSGKTFTMVGNVPQLLRRKRKDKLPLPTSLRSKEGRLGVRKSSLSQYPGSGVHTTLFSSPSLNQAAMEGENGSQIPREMGNAAAASVPYSSTGMKGMKEQEKYKAERNRSKANSLEGSAKKSEEKTTFDVPLSSSLQMERQQQGLFAVTNLFEGNDMGILPRLVEVLLERIQGQGHISQKRNSETKGVGETVLKISSLDSLSEGFDHKLSARGVESRSVSAESVKNIQNSNKVRSSGKTSAAIISSLSNGWPTFSSSGWSHTREDPLQRRDPISVNQKKGESARESSLLLPSFLTTDSKGPDKGSSGVETAGVCTRSHYPQHLPRSSSSSACSAPSSAPGSAPRHTANLSLRGLRLYGMELYNDVMLDLLDPRKRPVKYWNDTGGLSSICELLDRQGAELGGRGSGGGMNIENMEDLFHGFQFAMKNRTTLSHTLNDTSSRSHAVFIIQLRFELALNDLSLQPVFLPFTTSTSTSEGREGACEHESYLTASLPHLPLFPSPRRSVGGPSGAKREDGDGNPAGRTSEDNKEELRHAVAEDPLSFTVTDVAHNTTGNTSNNTSMKNVNMNPNANQRNAEGETTTREGYSYIALVDLAGCERVKETNVEGVALKEAQYINKSLSALSSVMLALYQRSPHVPYRDSKLTRLLRPCLEEGRVMMLVHVAPCSGTDSLNSLKFADQIRHTQIRTHDFSDARSQLQHQFEKLMDPTLRALEKNIQELKAVLAILCAEVRLSYLSRSVPMTAASSSQSGGAMHDSSPSSRLKSMTIHTREGDEIEHRQLPTGKASVDGVLLSSPGHEHTPSHPTPTCHDDDGKVDRCSKGELMAEGASVEAEGASVEAEGEGSFVPLPCALNGSASPPLCTAASTEREGQQERGKEALLQPISCSPLLVYSSSRIVGKTTPNAEHTSAHSPSPSLLHSCSLVKGDVEDPTIFPLSFACTPSTSRIRACVQSTIQKFIEYNEAHFAEAVAGIEKEKERWVEMGYRMLEREMKHLYAMIDETDQYNRELRSEMDLPTPRDPYLLELNREITDTCECVSQLAQEHSQYMSLRALLKKRMMGLTELERAIEVELAAVQNPFQNSYEPPMGFPFLLTSAASAPLSPSLLEDSIALPLPLSREWISRNTVEKIPIEAEKGSRAKIVQRSSACPLGEESPPPFLPSHRVPLSSGASSFFHPLELLSSPGECFTPSSFDPSSHTDPRSGTSPSQPTSEDSSSPISAEQGPQRAMSDDLPPPPVMMSATSVLNKNTPSVPSASASGRFSPCGLSAANVSKALSVSGPQGTSLSSCPSPTCSSAFSASPIPLKDALPPTSRDSYTSTSALLPLSSSENMGALSSSGLTAATTPTHSTKESPSPSLLPPQQPPRLSTCFLRPLSHDSLTTSNVLANSRIRSSSSNAMNYPRPVDKASSPPGTTWSPSTSSRCSSALEKVNSISTVEVDKELREISFQQVLLSQSFSALRMEVHSFATGESLWEGLWAQAMRRELMMAMRVERFLMETILLEEGAAAAASGLLLPENEEEWSEKDVVGGGEKEKERWWWVPPAEYGTRAGKKEKAQRREILFRCRRIQQYMCRYRGVRPPTHSVLPPLFLSSPPSAPPVLTTAFSAHHSSTPCQVETTSRGATGTPSSLLSSASSSFTSTTSASDVWPVANESSYLSRSSASSSLPTSSLPFHRGPSPTSPPFPQRPTEEYTRRGEWGKERTEEVEEGKVAEDDEEEIIIIRGRRRRRHSLQAALTARGIFLDSEDLEPDEAHQGNPWKAFREEKEDVEKEEEAINPPKGDEPLSLPTAFRQWMRGTEGEHQEKGHAHPHGRNREDSIVVRRNYTPRCMENEACNGKDSEKKQKQAGSKPEMYANNLEYAQEGNQDTPRHRSDMKERGSNEEATTVGVKMESDGSPHQHRHSGKEYCSEEKARRYPTRTEETPPSGSLSFPSPNTPWIIPSLGSAGLIPNPLDDLYWGFLHRKQQEPSDTGARRRRTPRRGRNAITSIGKKERGEDKCSIGVSLCSKRPPSPAQKCGHRQRSNDPTPHSFPKPLHSPPWKRSAWPSVPEDHLSGALPSSYPTPAENRPLHRSSSPSEFCGESHSFHSISYDAYEDSMLSGTVEAGATPPHHSPNEMPSCSWSYSSPDSSLQHTTRPRTGASESLASHRTTPAVKESGATHPQDRTSATDKDDVPQERPWEKDRSGEDSEGEQRSPARSRGYFEGEAKVMQHTRIKPPALSFLLEEFLENGAPGGHEGTAHRDTSLDPKRSSLACNLLADNTAITVRRTTSGLVHQEDSASPLPLRGTFQDPSCGVAGMEVEKGKFTPLATFPLLAGVLSPASSPTRGYEVHFSGRRKIGRDGHKNKEGSHAESDLDSTPEDDATGYSFSVSPLSIQRGAGSDGSPTWTTTGRAAPPPFSFSTVPSRDTEDPDEDAFSSVYNVSISTSLGLSLASQTESPNLLDRSHLSHRFSPPLSLRVGPRGQLASEKEQHTEKEMSVRWDISCKPLSPASSHFLSGRPIAEDGEEKWRHHPLRLRHEKRSLTRLPVSSSLGGGRSPKREGRAENELDCSEDWSLVCAAGGKGGDGRGPLTSSSFPSYAPLSPFAMGSSLSFLSPHRRVFSRGDGTPFSNKLGQQDEMQDSMMSISVTVSSMSASNFVSSPLPSTSISHCYSGNNAPSRLLMASEPEIVGNVEALGHGEGERSRDGYGSQENFCSVIVSYAGDSLSLPTEPGPSWKLLPPHSSSSFRSRKEEESRDRVEEVEEVNEEERCLNATRTPERRENVTDDMEEKGGHVDASDVEVEEEREEVKHEEGTPGSLQEDVFVPLREGPSRRQKETLRRTPSSLWSSHSGSAEEEEEEEDSMAVSHREEEKPAVLLSPPCASAVALHHPLYPYISLFGAYKEESALQLQSLLRLRYDGIVCKVYCIPSNFEHILHTYLTPENNDGSTVVPLAHWTDEDEKRMRWGEVEDLPMRPAWNDTSCITDIGKGGEACVAQWGRLCLTYHPPPSSRTDLVSPPLSSSLLRQHIRNLHHRRCEDRPPLHHQIGSYTLDFYCAPYNRIPPPPSLFLSPFCHRQKRAPERKKERKALVMITVRKRAMRRRGRQTQKSVTVSLPFSSFSVPSSVHFPEVRYAEEEGGRSQRQRWMARSSTSRFSSSSLLEQQLAHPFTREGEQGEPEKVLPQDAHEWVAEEDSASEPQEESNAEEDSWMEDEEEEEVPFTTFRGQEEYEKDGHQCTGVRVKKNLWGSERLDTSTLPFRSLSLSQVSVEDPRYSPQGNYSGSASPTRPMRMKDPEWRTYLTSNKRTMGEDMMRSTRFNARLPHRHSARDQHLPFLPASYGRRCWGHTFVKRGKGDGTKRADERGGRGCKSEKEEDAEAMREPYTTESERRYLTRGWRLFSIPLAEPSLLLQLHVLEKGSISGIPIACNEVWQTDVPTSSSHQQENYRKQGKEPSLTPIHTEERKEAAYGQEGSAGKEQAPCIAATRTTAIPLHPSEEVQKETKNSDGALPTSPSPKEPSPFSIPPPCELQVSTSALPSLPSVLEKRKTVKKKGGKAAGKDDGKPPRRAPKSTGVENVHSSTTMKKKTAGRTEKGAHAATATSTAVGRSTTGHPSKSVKENPVMNSNHKKEKKPIATPSLSKKAAPAALSSGKMRDSTRKPPPPPTRPSSLLFPSVDREATTMEPKPGEKDPMLEKKDAAKEEEVPYGGRDPKGPEEEDEHKKPKEDMEETKAGEEPNAKEMDILREEHPAGKRKQQQQENGSPPLFRPFGGPLLALMVQGIPLNNKDEAHEGGSGEEKESQQKTSTFHGEEKKRRGDGRGLPQSDQWRIRRMKPTRMRRGAALTEGCTSPPPYSHSPHKEEIARKKGPGMLSPVEGPKMNEKSPKADKKDVMKRTPFLSTKTSSVMPSHMTPITTEEDGGKRGEELLTSSLITKMHTPTLLCGVPSSSFPLSSEVALSRRLPLGGELLLPSSCAVPLLCSSAAVPLHVRGTDKGTPSSPEGEAAVEVTRSTSPSLLARGARPLMGPSSSPQERSTTTATTCGSRGIKGAACTFLFSFPSPAVEPSSATSHMEAIVAALSGLLRPRTSPTDTALPSSQGRPNPHRGAWGRWSGRRSTSPASTGPSVAPPLPPTTRCPWCWGSPNVPPERVQGEDHEACASLSSLSPRSAPLQRASLSLSLPTMTHIVAPSLPGKVSSSVPSHRRDESMTTEFSTPSSALLVDSSSSSCNASHGVYSSSLSSIRVVYPSLPFLLLMMWAEEKHRQALEKAKEEEEWEWNDVWNTNAAILPGLHTLRKEEIKKRRRRGEPEGKTLADDPHQAGSEVYSDPYVGAHGDEERQQQRDEEEGSGPNEKLTTSLSTAETTSRALSPSSFFSTSSLALRSDAAPRFPSPTPPLMFTAIQKTRQTTSSRAASPLSPLTQEALTEEEPQGGREHSSAEGVVQTSTANVKDEKSPHRQEDVPWGRANRPPRDYPRSSSEKETRRDEEEEGPQTDGDTLESERWPHKSDGGSTQGEKVYREGPQEEDAGGTARFIPLPSSSFFGMGEKETNTSATGVPGSLDTGDPHAPHRTRTSLMQLSPPSFFSSPEEEPSTSFSGGKECASQQLLKRLPSTTSTVSFSSLPPPDDEKEATETDVAREKIVRKGEVRHGKEGSREEHRKEPTHCTHLDELPSAWGSSLEIILYFPGVPPPPPLLPSFPVLHAKEFGSGRSPVRRRSSSTASPILSHPEHLLPSSSSLEHVTAVASPLSPPASDAQGFPLFHKESARDIEMDQVRTAKAALSVLQTVRLNPSPSTVFDGSSRHSGDGTHVSPTGTANPNRNGNEKARGNAVMERGWSATWKAKGKQTIPQGSAFSSIPVKPSIPFFTSTTTPLSFQESEKTTPGQRLGRERRQLTQGRRKAQEKMVNDNHSKGYSVLVSPSPMAWMIMDTLAPLLLYAASFRTLPFQPYPIWCPSSTSRSSVESANGSQRDGVHMVSRLGSVPQPFRSIPRGTGNTSEPGEGRRKDRSHHSGSHYPSRSSLDATSLPSFASAVRNAFFKATSVVHHRTGLFLWDPFRVGSPSSFVPHHGSWCSSQAVNEARKEEGDGCGAVYPQASLTRVEAPFPRRSSPHDTERDGQRGVATLWSSFEGVASHMRWLDIFRRNIRQLIKQQLYDAEDIRSELPPALLWSQEQMQRPSFPPPSASLEAGAPHQLASRRSSIQLYDNGLDGSASEQGIHFRTFSGQSSLSSGTYSHPRFPSSPSSSTFFPCSSSASVWHSLCSPSSGWTADRRCSVSSLRQHQQQLEQQWSQERTPRNTRLEGQEEEEDIEFPSCVIQRGGGGTGSVPSFFSREYSEDDDEGVGVSTHDPPQKEKVVNNGLIFTYHEEIEREAAACVGVALPGRHVPSPDRRTSPCRVKHSSTESISSPETGRMSTSPAGSSSLGAISPSECREVFGNVVPWTIWQWAYRWPMLSQVPPPKEQEIEGSGAENNMQQRSLHSNRRSMREGGESPPSPYSFSSPLSRVPIAAAIHTGIHNSLPTEREWPVKCDGNERKGPEVQRHDQFIIITEEKRKRGPGRHTGSTTSGSTTTVTTTTHTLIPGEHAIPTNGLQKSKWPSLQRNDVDSESEVDDSSEERACHTSGRGSTTSSEYDEDDEEEDEINRFGAAASWFEETLLQASHSPTQKRSKIVQFSHLYYGPVPTYLGGVQRA